MSCGNQRTRTGWSVCEIGLMAGKEVSWWGGVSVSGVSRGFGKREIPSRFSFSHHQWVQMWRGSLVSQ